MSLGYGQMNVMDKIVSLIRDFIEGMSPAQKNNVLDLLEISIKELKGGYNTHK